MREEGKGKKRRSAESREMFGEPGCEWWSRVGVVAGRGDDLQEGGETTNAESAPPPPKSREEGSKKKRKSKIRSDQTPGP